MKAVLRTLLVGLLVLASHAAAQEVTEAAVKAAYLYRFLSFVDWPPDTLPPGAPLVIGVAGETRVFEELRGAVSGRTAQSRTVEVRRLAPEEPLPATLHALFISRSAASRIPALVRKASRGTLVVTEVPGGLDAGAAINFVETGGRIRFSVSLPAAERAGLRIGSRMLAVAEEVRPSPP